MGLAYSTRKDVVRNASIIAGSTKEITLDRVRDLHAAMSRLGNFSKGESAYLNQQLGIMYERTGAEAAREVMTMKSQLANGRMGSQPGEKVGLADALGMVVRAPVLAYQAIRKGSVPIATAALVGGAMAVATGTGCGPSSKLIEAQKSAQDYSNRWVRANAEIGELKRINEKTQTAFDKANSNYTDAVSKIDTLREDMDKFRKEFDAKYNAKVEELASARKAVAVAEGRAANTETAIKVLRSENEVKVANMKYAIGSLEKEKKGLRGGLETLTGKYRALESNYATATGQVDSLITENKGLAGRIAATTSRLKTSERKGLELQTQYASATNSLAQEVKAKQTLNNQISRAGKEKDRLRLENKRLRDELRTAQTEERPTSVYDSKKQPGIVKSSVVSSNAVETRVEAPKAVKAVTYNFTTVSPSRDFSATTTSNFIRGNGEEQSHYYFVGKDRILKTSPRGLAIARERARARGEKVDEPNHNQVLTDRAKELEGKRKKQYEADEVNPFNLVYTHVLNAKAKNPETAKGSAKAAWTSMSDFGKNVSRLFTASYFPRDNSVTTNDFKFGVTFKDLGNTVNEWGRNIAGKGIGSDEDPLVSVPLIWTTQSLYNGPKNTSFDLLNLTTVVDNELKPANGLLDNSADIVKHTLHMGPNQIREWTGRAPGAGYAISSLVDVMNSFFHWGSRIVTERPLAAMENPSEAARKAGGKGVRNMETAGGLFWRSLGAREAYGDDNPITPKSDIGGGIGGGPGGGK